MVSETVIRKSTRLSMDRTEYEEDSKRRHIELRKREKEVRERLKDCDSIHRLYKQLKALRCKSDAA